MRSFITQLLLLIESFRWRCKNYELNIENAMSFRYITSLFQVPRKFFQHIYILNFSLIKYFYC